VSRCCDAVLLLAFAVTAALCAACVDRDNDGFSGGLAPSVPPPFGSSGGPTRPGGSLPPLTFPARDAGAMAPIDVPSCLSNSAKNAQGLATPDCLKCLCSIAPEPTVACDHDCWTLISCVQHSSCRDGDTACIVDRCTAPLGDVARLASAGMFVQQIPFKECSMICTRPAMDAGADEDGGSSAPTRVDCEPLVAEPESVQVGESIALRFDPAVQPGDYTLSVAPWGSVGSIHRDAAGSSTFRCDAPGSAVIAIESDACTATLSSVFVTCVPQEGSSCCPIDPIGESATGRCTQFGGSPPCFLGCDCLRNGGVYYSEPDAQGCLQWRLRPSRDSEEDLVCLDEAGDPNPDPRNAR